MKGRRALAHAAGNRLAERDGKRQLILINPQRAMPAIE
jgi:hypothetical protein